MQKLVSVKLCFLPFLSHKTTQQKHLQYVMRCMLTSCGSSNIGIYMHVVIWFLCLLSSLLLEHISVVWSHRGLFVFPVPHLPFVSFLSWLAVATEETDLYLMCGSGIQPHHPQQTYFCNILYKQNIYLTVN